MGSTRPNPTHVGWVRLNFFLPTMVGWVKKSPQPDPTQPMHTPRIINQLHNIFYLFIILLNDKGPRGTSICNVSNPIAFEALEAIA